MPSVAVVSTDAPARDAVTMSVFFVRAYPASIVAVSISLATAN